MITNILDLGERSIGTRFYLYGYPDLPVPDEQLWQCNWIVDQIYRATSLRPDRSDIAPIYASWWLKVLTGKYIDCLRSLMNAGVLERFGGYVPKEHPYSYRLAPPYQQPELLECPDRCVHGPSPTSIPELPRACPSCPSLTAPSHA